MRKEAGVIQADGLSQNKAQALRNSILFNNKVYSGKGKAMDSIVNKLYSDLNFENKNYLLARKKLALNNILSNLLIASLNEKYLAISKRKNNYTIPGLYGMSHFRYAIFISLITSLRDMGYIDEAPGFYDAKKEIGFRTRISLTQKSLELFSENSTFQKFQYDSPVILKNSDKNIIPYKINRLTKKMAKFLDEYNTLIKYSDITLPIKQIKKMRQKNEDIKFIHPFIPNTRILNTYDIIITEVSNKKDTTPLLVRSYDKPLSDRELECRLYRVFNDESFSKGGRFFGAEYQQLKKEDRLLIQIDNSPVTEVDFKGLHLNMLYNFEGIDFEGDPYTKINSNPELRPLLKKVALIAINAETKQQAINALNYELLKDYDLYQIKKRYNLKTNELFSKFEDAHPTISKYLRSGVGIKLQNVDSRIAESVLKYFTKKEIPCLCVHDSFLVDEKYEDELCDVMKESYQKYLGFPGKVKVEGGAR